MTILRYEFTHGINVLWHNDRLGRTFTDLVFEWASATIEFIEPVFHSAEAWCFIANERLWRSYKRVLKHRNCILPTFPYTIRHEPFFERLSNCAGSYENKSSLLTAVPAILNVCCWKKSPRMPLPHGMSHDDLALWVYARHQCSLAELVFE